MLFYTHISDQYAPFHTKVINSPVRDATHVLDGLLYHESELRIEEHYTDTAGFTDHVFALCHFLGFEFAPRIGDLADKNLYVPGKAGDWPALLSLVGGSINRKLIEREFDDVVRLAASIQQGTVTASLILRKLTAYPRQNGLAIGLRELGRIERTLFTLKWLQDPALRRRVSAGLNKGEARNSLARAVFFYRLGEIRDRSYENQRYRASGLNLVVAAITLWNSVYLERAIAASRQQREIDESLIPHIAPLGWNHINLTGDYVWHANKRVATALTAAKANSTTPVISGFMSARTYQVIGAGAEYVIGAISIDATYSNTQFKSLGDTLTSGPNPIGYNGSTSFNNGELTVRYRITPAFLVGAAYNYTKGSTTATRTGTDPGATYHQGAIGADYLLSKATDIYFIGVFQKASGTDSRDKPAVAAINGVTASSSDQQTVLRVGIRHKF